MSKILSTLFAIILVVASVASTLLFQESKSKYEAAHTYPDLQRKYEVTQGEKRWLTKQWYIGEGDSAYFQDDVGRLVRVYGTYSIEERFDTLTEPK